MNKRSQTIDQVLNGLTDQPLPAIAVKNAVLDSREVQRGDVFVALKGAQLDGTRFISAAVAQGAVACLVEQGQSADLNVDVPLLEIQNLAARLPEIAMRMSGNASEHMLNFAVTGTNGKTSCALAFAAISSALGQRCGAIGTLGWGVGQSFQETGHTTPDTLSLYRIMTALADDGCTAAAMEMSSHALQQQRAQGLALDVAMITNITRDHLDYHGSFDAYAAAKGRLLQWPGLQLAVVNADDAACMALPVTCQRLSYSVEGNQQADVWVDGVQSAAQGMSATMHTPWGQAQLSTPMLAQFNLSNLLGVVTALAGLGHELAAVVSAAAAFVGVPGRMQRVENSLNITVLVDYAHTPDALENALQALKPLTKKRLLVLFGCGGDRDKGKRPLMGAVASRLADYAVVTSDNPRSESPQAIIDDICGGMTGSHYELCLDRREAIVKILDAALPGDIVLIAGKGHETYQILGDQVIEFDDVAIAASALQSGEVRQ